MRERLVKALLDTKGATGERLPSVRQLSLQWGVAMGTVSKVLETLREQGHIRSVPSKGYFWGTTVTITVPLPRTLPIETLDQRFREDWKKGYFDPRQSLPSLKELCTRYQASRPLLRKFLQKQQSLGLLGRVGQKRYYFLSSQDPQTHQEEILLITRCNKSGYFPSESDREMEFLKSVYRSAHERNLKLSLLGFNEEKKVLLDRSGNRKSLSDYPHCLGALISTLLIQKPRELLSIFSKSSFPVAVWWEHPPETTPHSLKNKENWAFFNSTFGKFPGRIVGEFLASHHYHKVLFISPYHNSSWSKDRLEGLKEAGLQITPLVDAQHASPWDFREEARQKGPQHSLEVRARKYCSQILLKLLHSRKFFDVEAWVCVNDEVASILSELHDEGKLSRPPYMIAFDNTIESYLLRLDSFEFNMETMVQHAFFHLTSKGINPFDNDSFHEIFGHVVEK